MDRIGACGSELWETTYSEGEDASSSGESEGLSDIDDAEVDSYLNDEKEKHYKKIIWEKLNKKYVQEQEAKKTAAAANVLKPKTEGKRKRAKEVKKAQSTAQKASPALPKRTSSKVNYDALYKLLNEPLPSDNPKRSRTESVSDQNVGKSSVESRASDDELQASENEDEEDGWEENQDYSCYNDQEQEYNDYYDDDDIY